MNKIMDKTTSNHTNLNMQNNKNILIKDVNVFARKKCILKNLSFDIKCGDIHGFIGPNGAGKTTTIKAMIGAIPLQTGEIVLNRTVKVNGKLQTNIGYLPECLKYNPRFKVKKILLQSSWFHGFSKTHLYQKIDEFHDILDVTPYLKTQISKLSSGQQKLVMLLDAILSNPDILILDEPMENLDPSIRMKIFDFLKKYINDKPNRIVFISSHVLEELKDFCDSITLINFGEIVYDGKSKIETKNFIVNIESLMTKEIKQLFKKNKIIDIKNHKIKIEFKDKITVNEVSKLLIDNKIEFSGINVYYKDVVDIYKEFVIHSKQNDNKGLK